MYMNFHGLIILVQILLSNMDARRRRKRARQTNVEGSVTIRYGSMLGVAFFSLMSMTASATPISFGDLVDFGGACPGDTNSCDQLTAHVGDDSYYPGLIDEDFLQIDGNVEEFDFLHEVTFSPHANKVLQANLSITHRGNGANDLFEAWVVKSFTGQGSQSILVGNLSFSNAIWVTDTFTIPDAIFDGVNGGSWALTLRAEDEASREDNGIKLASSYLSGEYLAIPEPGTLALLGLGFAGMGIGRRRKKV